jgi:hypothetical protein
MSFPGFRVSVCLSFLMAALLGAGCSGRRAAMALPREDSPAARVARRHLEELSRLERAESRSWTVAARSLKGMPWLVADAETELRLANLESFASDPNAFDAEARATLERMLELGWKSHETSLKGLDGSDALAAMARPAFDALAQGEAELLESLVNAEDRRAWVKRLRRALPGNPDQGGPALRTLATLPLAPILYAWMGYHILIEDRGPAPRDFQRVRVYEPDRSRDAEIAARLANANSDELLAFYAPAIVQEIAANPAYAPDSDRVGFAELVADPQGEPVASVNPSRAAVYGSVGQAYLGGSWRQQLSYSFWYPEHPALHGSFDPEAGPAEGWLVRVTLDAKNEPLIVETVAACGCYHRVFPADGLEEAARRQFGNIETNGSALARANRFKIDAYIPETLGRFDPAEPHLALHVKSGSHQIAAAKLSGLADFADAAERQRCELLPSEELFRLPWRGGVASFFGRDGLVREADRLEATLLFPTGIYHAGTPRLDQTRLIHFDQYSYSDPTLLDKLLRLPKL